MGRIVSLEATEISWYNLATSGIGPTTNLFASPNHGMRLLLHEISCFRFFQGRKPSQISPACVRTENFVGLAINRKSRAGQNFTVLVPELRINVVSRMKSVAELEQ